MKTNPYWIANACTFLAMALGVWLMWDAPELLVNAWMAGATGGEAPNIPAARQAYQVMGYIAIFLLGFVIPEKILRKAYREQPSRA